MNFQTAINSILFLLTNGFRKIPFYLKSNILLIIAIFISLLCFQNYVYAQTKSSNVDAALAHQLQTMLDSQRISFKIKGASTAIIFPERGTWHGVSGISDTSDYGSIKPDMLFGIGSTTKNVVAALILKLVEEGKISLQDPLYKWLPQFQNIDSTITVYQLLNHTSGVCNFTNDAWTDSVYFANPTKYWTPEEVIKIFVGAPYFPKGSKWLYSNTNYILLGMIIEKVTQNSVEKVFQKYFWRPTKLHIFLIPQETISGSMAHAWHDFDGDTLLVDITSIPETARYSTGWTAGALVSNAEDLAKWSKLLYEGKIIKKESINQMLTFEKINYGPCTGYGLGVMRVVYHDKEYWGHGGIGLGYTALTLYSPNNRLSIAVLINQNNAQAIFKICESLLKVVNDFL